MTVSFLNAAASLIQENVVKIDYTLNIEPVVRQPQLYDLCGSTLSLMFDLSVPYANAVIEPLLNVSAIGNQCPPLRALNSTNVRGFTCSVGEVLNMDTNDVPRCCKYYYYYYYILLKIFFLYFSHFSTLSGRYLCWRKTKRMYLLPTWILPKS